MTPAALAASTGYSGTALGVEFGLARRRERAGRTARPLEVAWSGVGCRSWVRGSDWRLLDGRWVRTPGCTCRSGKIPHFTWPAQGVNGISEPHLAAIEPNAQVQTQIEIFSLRHEIQDRRSSSARCQSTTRVPSRWGCRESTTICPGRYPGRWSAYRQFSVAHPQGCAAQSSLPAAAAW